MLEQNRKFPVIICYRLLLITAMSSSERTKIVDSRTNRVYLKPVCLYVVQYAELVLIGMAVAVIIFVWK